MSSFDIFMNNEVTLVRKDGTSQKFKCNIQSKGISIQDVTIKVTEGDEIHYFNPAGLEEVYLVDEVMYSTPSFAKDMHHIAVKYTKKGSKKDLEKSSQNYHLINSNLAINSTNLNQTNNIIKVENLTINDPEVLQKVNELNLELSNPQKDKNKIGDIIQFIISKAPDVVIGILVNLLVP